MQRTPTLVLICGILCAGLGIVLLAVSDRVDGLAWLAAPICILGLVLVGLWLRTSRGKAAPEEVPWSAPVVPGALPGKWYLYAVMGIVAALFGWILYWTRLR